MTSRAHRNDAIRRARLDRALLVLFFGCAASGAVSSLLGTAQALPEPRHESTPRAPGAALLDDLDLPSLSAPATGEPLPMERGVALPLDANDVSFSYTFLLDEIVALGATDVAVTVPLFQEDARSDRPRWHTRRSPPLTVVADTIREARRRRLGVTVTPDLRLEHAAPGESRRTLAPRHRAAWFRAYADALGDLAAIAAATGADRLGLGAELSTLDGAADEGSWRSLLERLRGLFHGPIVYGAAWERPRACALLRLVDQPGVAAFFPLRRADQPANATTLTASWAALRGDLLALAGEFGKPLLLTAVGYRSLADSTLRPWDDAARGVAAPDEQREGWRAFRQALAQTPDQPFIRGFYVWSWSGPGGPRSTGFSPRGKPAEEEVRALLQAR